MKSENPIFLYSIDEEINIPLYYQLVSIIKRNISAGLIKTGDALPTESELCEKFSISRSTVRHAVGELEKEGLIIRRRGKGTFISEPKIKRNMEDVYSFSKEMRSLGLKPSSKILSFETITAKMDIMKNLGIKHSDQKVFKIVRIRLANGEPMLLETAYIPVYVIPNLTKEMILNESLYMIIKETAGIVPYEAQESYESIILEKDVACLLKCKQYSSGFYIERRTKTSSGEVYEFTQSLMRGDRTKFVITLRNDEVLFNRKVNKK